MPWFASEYLADEVVVDALLEDGGFPDEVFVGGLLADETKKGEPMIRAEIYGILVSKRESISPLISMGTVSKRGLVRHVHLSTGPF